MPDLFLSGGLFVSLLFVWVLAADRSLAESLQQGPLVMAAAHQPWSAPSMIPL